MDIDHAATPTDPKLTERERRDKWRVLVGLVCPPPPVRQIDGGRGLSAGISGLGGIGGGAVASASRVRSDTRTPSGWSV